MRRNVILGMVMVMVLAACAGGDAAEWSDTEATSAPTAIGGEAAMDDEAAGEEVAIRASESRKVIHRASISIEAEDTRGAYTAISDMVDAVDGFIESATIADPQSGQDQPRIDLVLRVPADDLRTTVEEIGALGTRVVSQSQSGQDVTEEYIDIEARISNLSLLENELRALLEDVRQQDDVDPAKLLQVFNEISRVRGEIEQLQGRQQVLDDLTSLATVEVGITPTPETTPVVAEGWAPLAVVRQSLQDLVGAFQGIGDLAIRATLYFAPLALLFVGLPALAAWRLRRRVTP